MFRKRAFAKAGKHTGTLYPLNWSEFHLLTFSRPDLKLPFQRSTLIFIFFLCMIPWPDHYEYYSTFEQYAYMTMTIALYHYYHHHIIFYHYYHCCHCHYHNYCINDSDDDDDDDDDDGDDDDDDDKNNNENNNNLIQQWFSQFVTWRQQAITVTNWSPVVSWNFHPNLVTLQENKWYFIH